AIPRPAPTSRTSVGSSTGSAFRTGSSPAARMRPWKTTPQRLPRRCGPPSATAGGWWWGGAPKAGRRRGLPPLWGVGRRAGGRGDQVGGGAGGVAVRRYRAAAADLVGGPLGLLAQAMGLGRHGLDGDGREP